MPLPYEIRANNTIVDPDTEEVLGRVPSELCPLFSNAQDFLEVAQTNFSNMAKVELNPHMFWHLLKLGRAINKSGGSAGFWEEGKYRAVKDFDYLEKIVEKATQVSQFLLTRLENYSR